MAEADIDAEVPVAAVPAASANRALRWVGGIAAALVLLVLVAVWGIDTTSGHRFIADRIGALSPRSGLRIKVGRIDGSVWGKARIHDLRLYDPNGLFLEAPDVSLDWNPAKWLVKRLDIDSLRSDLVVLHRLPKLLPTGRKGPILPGFDIRIGALDARVRIDPGAADRQARLMRLTGAADIRGGRALVALKAMASGGDRLALMLDAEPDRDRFDLEARLIAPANGTFGALAGTKRSATGVITGKGTWSAWNGHALLDVGADPGGSPCIPAASCPHGMKAPGTRIADLGLGVRNGRYSLGGMIAPASLWTGKKARLSTPRIAISGNATLAARRLTGSAALRSAALAIGANGTIDLAESAFDHVTIDTRLLRPPALFPNMTGTGIHLRTTLDGPFATAAFTYQAAAPRLAFDDTGFEEVRAAGRGRLSRTPIAVPIRFTARRVTGVGTVAGGILANLTVDGVLKVTATKLTGDGLRIDSDKIKGKLQLLVDLVSGEYDVGLSGQLTRYLIPGLGIVDVSTEVKVVPGAGGHGTVVAGRGHAWVRRFDNAFLRSLAGGLPEIETKLVRGPDRVLHFVDLVLTAPAIRIAGSGIRRIDGTFQFTGQGRQAQYGPLKLALDGQIDKPRLDILLDRPMDALGLTAVRALLDPTPQGFAWRAAGGSTLGPFTGQGQILLPSNEPAIIGVAALDVSGTRATGAVRSLPGGFNGKLAVAGGGLSGTLLFSPVGTIQRIDMHLAAHGATIATAVPLVVRQGALDGALLLDPAGTTLTGTASGAGLRRGGISLARLTASAKLRGGVGEVRAAFAGSRGRAFAFDTVTQVAPGRFAVAATGTVDRRPLQLTAPAVLTSDGDAWRLAPTSLTFSGGTATVAGRFGGASSAIDARVSSMPLSVLDIGFPALGLGGTASGRVSYSQAAAGVLPRGSIDVRIRGLTRSGLVLSSKPVDVGLVAVLDGRNAAARAIAQSGGQIVGRAQARLSPLPDAGTLADRLAAAPLFAQLRYSGPADTLWRLTGVETIDVSGPVAIGADIGGRLGNPVIRGSLHTDAARLESAVTGTIVTGLKANGRFDGSRLIVDSFAGATKGGGTLTGRAAFDLAAAHGLGMDIAVNSNSALLLNRDDLGATVTGIVTIKSDGAGGIISGDVKLDKSRFRLGSATAAAAVPNLPVTEINRPADEAEAAAAPQPWRLDLKADARNQLAVSGLGLDSEWRAGLTIKGTVDNPAIGGRADLVRGSYEFAGRRFDLDRGAIRFTGVAPADPVLDIVAKANLQGLNATISVSGTGQHPQIDFASVPALPADELLSRLLFGTSITNLSAPEALQLAAAVAALRNGGGSGGLDPINMVRKAAGLDRLRIVPADVTTGQRTSIAAGKYIGRRTYVEIITDGQGYSATRAEFQITRWLSVLSTISTIGRQSANVRVSKDY